MRPGDRVAAAVSGGADSVALLCLLLELRAELGIVLSIAHVNHKLRGEESDEDERFVAKLARQRGLDLHVRQAPVGGSECGINSGVEGAARALRYDFFRELAQEGRVTKIATAHTLDDQAETVLLRIFRGTGMRGLAGIHPRIIFKTRVSQTSAEPSARSCGRCSVFVAHDLQKFLREQDQSWREDSSNRDLAFLRNRVRHRLLPMIIGRIWRISDRTHGRTGGNRSSRRRTLESWSSGDADGRAGTDWQPRLDFKRRSATSGDPTRWASVGAPFGGAASPLRGWLETNARGLDISFRLIEQALELAGEPAGRKIEMPSGLESPAWTAKPYVWNSKIRSQGERGLSSMLCPSRAAVEYS